MPENDFWSPDPGLKDDFDGVVYGGEWIQGTTGTWSAVLNIIADDEDDVKVFLNLGPSSKDWKSVDGGESIVGAHPRQKLHERSAMWQWIKAAMAAGARDELFRRDQEDFGGKGPFHIAIWNGLEFHYDVVEEDGRVRNDAGDWVAGKVKVLRPTKYLGNGEEAKPAPKARTSSRTAPSSTSPANTSATNGHGISEADLHILRELAGRHPDRGAFADAVLETPDSSGNPFIKNTNVIKAMSREDWYEELKA